jgi:DNA-binding MarR family transcriptional regulator
LQQPRNTDDITYDHELDVLSQIHHNQKMKQRDIAHAIGLSLGMTNAILRRLAGKGFIAMRRINARNIHYLVTPAGIDLIARRSYRYLRRTVGHVVRYKEQMLELMHQQAAAPPAGRGVTSVVLVGDSDLEFLVEWCADKVGLEFRQTGEFASVSSPKQTGVSTPFVVAGEKIPLIPTPGPDGRLCHAWDLHLADLVVGARER